MKTYRIDVEATAKITLWVEAASEKEAREMAYACNYRLEENSGDESITGYHDGTQSWSPWVELEPPRLCEFHIDDLDCAVVKSVSEEGDTPPQKPTGRPQLSEADRLRRRAEASGDAAKAVVIAGRFHKFVMRLFVSQHAEIRYGPGGEQVKVWSGKYPKVWKNAGVWIDYAAEQIVFENHKGEAKSRLPLPPMKLVTFDGLEDGDLWGIARPDVAHVVERWGLDSNGVMIVHGYEII